MLCQKKATNNESLHIEYLPILNNWHFKTHSRVPCANLYFHAQWWGNVWKPKWTWCLAYWTMHPQVPWIECFVLQKKLITIAKWKSYQWKQLLVLHVMMVGGLTSKVVLPSFINYGIILTNWIVVWKSYEGNNM